MDATSEYRSSSAQDNVEKCKQLCMKNKDCVGIDFGINNIYDRNKGQCWLNFGTIKKTVTHKDFNSWKKNPACGMTFMITIANYISRLIDRNAVLLFFYLIFLRTKMYI